MTDSTSTCSRCKQTLPGKNFYLRTTGRFSSWCKPCSKDYDIRHRRRPKEPTYTRSKTIVIPSRDQYLNILRAI